MEAIVKTDFNFPGQTGHYVGKVRDVYSIGNDYLVMVVSDRISAFDVVLPKGIPFKGQVLNQIAAKFLDAIDVAHLAYIVALLTLEIKICLYNCFHCYIFFRLFVSLRYTQ